MQDNCKKCSDGVELGVACGEGLGVAGGGVASAGGGVALTGAGGGVASTGVV